MDHEGETDGVLHGDGFLDGGRVMRSVTLSRGGAPHPASSGRPTSVAPEARERVLERIRRALTDGDEAQALRIARELERRFEAARSSRPAARRAGAGAQG
jgi:hypothetical protein